MDTINHEGIEYSLSEKAGLYLPRDMAYQRDHPILSKAKSIGRTLGHAAAGAGIVALVAGPNIAASVAHAEEAGPMPQIEMVKQPKGYDLFAGNLTFGPQDEIDNVVTLDHKKGARFVLMTDHTPFADEPENNYSVAARSPVNSAGRQFEISIDNDHPKGSARGMILTRVTQENEVGRFGLAGDSSGLGLFAGVRRDLADLTIDGNLFFHNGRFNANGYFGAEFAVGEKTNAYLGFGRQTAGNVNSIFAGIWGKNGSGFYNKTIDKRAENKQSGTVIFVPKGFTYTPEAVRFRQAISVNADMHGQIADNTIAGWAPPNAFAVDGENGHIALVGDWSNDNSEIEVSPGLFYRPSKGQYFGITGVGNLDKNSLRFSPGVKADIYSIIPGTPLEAELIVNHNIRSGKTKTMFYGGLVKSF